MSMFTMTMNTVVVHLVAVETLVKKEYSYTNVGLYKQYQCKDCGKWMRSRYTLNTTAKRKALLKGE